MAKELENIDSTPVDVETGEIVKSITLEGNLTRSGSTNSIKGTNQKLEKFGPVFESINSNLLEQTAILQASLDIDLKHEQDAALNKVSRTDPNLQDNSGNKKGKKGKIDDASMMDMIKGAIPALGGFYGALLGAGAVGFRALIKGGALLALAPLVRDFMGDFVKTGLESFDFDKDTAKTFGDAAGLASMGGMIGLAFGKRMGLVGAGAGFLASFGDDVLAAMDIDGTQMVAGMELNTLASSIMGLMGGALSLAITNPNIWKEIAGKAMAGGKWLGWKKMLGVGAAATIFTLYTMYGDEAKAWLKDSLGKDASSALVDTVSYTAMGASLGSTFGIHGMIVGAALGFAIGLGKSIYDWLTGMRDEASAKFKAELEDVAPELEAARDGTITQEGKEKIMHVVSEAKRRQDLALSDALIEEARLAEEAGLQALASLPMVAGEGVTGDQLSSNVKGALSGDDTKLEALYDYIDGLEAQRSNFSRTAPVVGKDRETWIDGMMSGLSREIDVMDYIERTEEGIDKEGNKVQVQISHEDALAAYKSDLDKFKIMVEALISSRNSNIPGNSQPDVLSIAPEMMTNISTDDAPNILITSDEIKSGDIKIIPIQSPDISSDTPIDKMTSPDMPQANIAMIDAPVLQAAVNNISMASPDAPIISMASPDISMASPDAPMASPDIYMASPDAPIISMASPDISMASPDASIITEKTAEIHTLLEIHDRIDHELIRLEESGETETSKYAELRDEFIEIGAKLVAMRDTQPIPTTSSSSLNILYGPEIEAKEAEVLSALSNLVARDIAPDVATKMKNIETMNSNSSSSTNIIYAPVSSSPVYVSQGGSSSSSIVGITNISATGGGQYGGLPGLAN